MQTVRSPRNVPPWPLPFEFGTFCRGKDNSQDPKTYQSNKKQRRTDKGLSRRAKSAKIYRQIE
jgi:hypothetical protein